jgi:hypothetical protein
MRLERVELHELCFFRLGDVVAVAGGLLTLVGERVISSGVSSGSKLRNYRLILYTPLFLSR